MVSPETTVPDIVAVVVVYAVCLSVSVLVAMSQAKQAQPLGAVALFPMVMTGAQAVCPAPNEPAVAPPVRAVGVPHPLAMVKVVPTDI